MESELKLPDTHNADAAVWAKSFCEHFPEFDEATANGWFANAMMAMHDHLMQTHEWNARPTASNELPADVLDEVRQALANLISVAERNIYPQPDKVSSDYAKLVSAKSVLAKLSGEVG